MNNTFQKMRAVAVSSLSYGKRSDDSETLLSEYYYFNSPIKWVLFIAFIMLILISVTGNALVLSIILKYPKMRTRTNMLLGNLAIIDLLTGLIAMPFSVTTVYHGTWVLGELACQINGFVNALFVAASIHTLMYISIHKYFAVKDVFVSALKGGHVALMIAAVWAWGFIFAGALVSGWTVIEYKNGTSQCGPKIPETGNLLQASHSIFTSITNFFIPLIIITFCYCDMFRNFRRYLSILAQKSHQFDAEEERANVLRKRKIVITLLIVLISFLICIAPYIAYSSSIAFFKDSLNVPGILNPIVYIFLFLSSCTNPIIYALRSKSFATGYRDIFCFSDSKQMKIREMVRMAMKKPINIDDRKTWRSSGVGERQKSESSSDEGTEDSGQENQRSKVKNRKVIRLLRAASARRNAYRPEKSTIQEERSSQLVPSDSFHPNGTIF